MPPESPRKSSTSSGNRFHRPRYLLVEVVGVPTLSPRFLEAILSERSVRSGPPIAFKIIRTEGSHGLVAVAHLDADRARGAWNGSSLHPAATVRTLRSYGTLLKGKTWLARRRTRGPGTPVLRERHGPG
jgi:hypothetical protein